MKIFLIVLFLLHGLIHLVGFVKPVQSLALASRDSDFSFISRISWFFGFALLFFSAYLFYQEFPKWWVLGFVAILFSQLLVVLSWKDAKWGTVANLVLLFAVVAGYASWQFDETSFKRIDTLLLSGFNKHQVMVEKDLNDLPYPVKNWLKHTGILGKERIHCIQLTQHGWMKQKPGEKKWIETSAIQYFITDPPGFVWTVKMNLPPGIEVKGRDEFSNGRGNMKISAFSMVDIVNDCGSKTDQGSLQRFLSEICWFPSAALSNYIQWTAIDSVSAKATMTCNGNSGSVVFYFDKSGDLKRCEADRFMGGGKKGKMEKWQVITKATGEVNGIRVPVESEVTWKLESGDFTWYKIKITGIAYEPAAQKILLK